MMVGSPRDEDGLEHTITLQADVSKTYSCSHTQTEIAFAKLSLKHKKHKARLASVYCTSLKIKQFLHY